MPPRAAVPAKQVRHLTPADLAERLGMSEDHLSNWRSQGKGPDYIRGEGDGKKALIRYPEAWVVEWEESRRVRVTA
jgi:Helix-turn-helix domain